MFPQFYDHLDEWLTLVPLSLGAGHYEFLHQYGAELDRNAAKENVDLMKKANALGQKLISE